MSSDVEEERPKKQRRAPKRKAHSDSEGEEDEKPKKQEKKKPGKRTTVPDRVQVQCTVTSDGKFAIQSKAPRVKKEPSPEELEKKKKRASSSSASSSTTTTTTVNKFADEFSLKGSFVATNFEAFNKTNARVIVKHVESGTTAPMDVLPFFEIAWKKLNVADVQWTGTARIEQVGAKIGLTFAADQKQQQAKKEKQQQKDSKEEKQASVPPPAPSSVPAPVPSAPAVSPFGF